MSHIAAVSATLERLLLHTRMQMQVTLLCKLQVHQAAVMSVHWKYCCGSMDTVQHVCMQYTVHWLDLMLQVISGCLSQTRAPGGGGEGGGEEAIMNLVVNHGMLARYRKFSIVQGRLCMASL